MSKTRFRPPSDNELASFHAIQETFSYLIMLVHHNANQTLCIDLDVFKEFRFDVVAFHTMGENVLPEEKWPSSTLIQPILFLFRLLTAAEKNC